jgi:uncharacterized protein YifN (PemK superfamily)
LGFLARDLYETSNASEYGRVHVIKTHKSGQLSFQEQYNYYKGQDLWVKSDAASYVSKNTLSPFLECFEQGSYEVHFPFVSAKGIERLKKERSDLWEKYELDKFV